MTLSGSLSGSRGISPSALPPGFDTRARPPVNSGPVALVNTSGAAQIAGPAAGYIRYIFNIGLATTTTTSATIAAQFNAGSGGPFLARAFSLAVTTGSNAALTNQTVTFLANGETLDFANTGAGDAVLWYSYIDVPATNLTPVRISFSDTPVEAIPPAPAGYYRRIATLTTGLGFSLHSRPLFFPLNDDTVAAQFCVYWDADLIGRSASTAAGVNASNVGPLCDMKLTTQSYKASTRVAVTTRNFNLFLVYETLPL